MATLAVRMAPTAAEQMGIAIRMIVGRIAPLRHAVTTRARKTSKMGMAICMTVGVIFRLLYAVTTSAKITRKAGFHPRFALIKRPYFSSLTQIHGFIIFCKS